MRVERLRLEQLRLFDTLEVCFGPAGNVLVGANGAGKTSVLESVHLLAYGRSFRGSVREGLIRRGQSSLSVFVELVLEQGARHRLGLQRSLRDWTARIDGEPVTALGDLYRRLAVVCFEPGSHELIAGGSEHRRRFVDWALFHVEPEFLPAWRRYQRALKQRNALLKNGAPDVGMLEVWEQELAESGERLGELREAWLTALLPELRRAAGRLLAELGEVDLKYSRGWSREHDSLRAALRSGRARDLALGHTSSGPHRADWSLGYAEAPASTMLSRGQEKLTALACLMAQAERFVAATGVWPVLLLDDLGSELDASHLGLALGWLGSIPAQWLLTGTSVPRGLPADTHVFHVEQGGIAPAAIIGQLPEKTP